MINKNQQSILEEFLLNSLSNPDSPQPIALTDLFDSRPKEIGIRSYNEFTTLVRFVARFSPKLKIVRQKKGMVIILVD